MCPGRLQSHSRSVRQLKLSASESMSGVSAPGRGSSASRSLAESRRKRISTTSNLAAAAGTSTRRRPRCAGAARSCEWKPGPQLAQRREVNPRVDKNKGLAGTAAEGTSCNGGDTDSPPLSNAERAAEPQTPRLGGSSTKATPAEQHKAEPGGGDRPTPASFLHLRGSERRPALGPHNDAGGGPIQTRETLRSMISRSTYSTQRALPKSHHRLRCKLSSELPENNSMNSYRVQGERPISEDAIGPGVSSCCPPDRHLDARRV